MPSKEIRVSALIAQNAAGELLTVRKHGTEMFMFPGGKPEPGETPLATILRETREETSLLLRAEQLGYLGEYRAAAANEPGYEVVAQVFRLTTAVDSQEIRLAAEIAELRWVDPAAPFTADLAPLAQVLIAALSA